MKKEIKIQDKYILNEPSGQNIIDIFKGEWSSKFPEGKNLITEPGTAQLFEDPRVIWAENILGSFHQSAILELGPLEGGHSFMFEERGAMKVTAIEANTHAFLKCLCVKEIFNLKNVEFKLGDFMSYLHHNSESFDLIFASGVLYHMKDPLQLLKLIAKATNKVFIWTHYFDKSIISLNPDIAHKFSDLCSVDYEGETFFYSTQSYKKALNWKGFCGGPATDSIWLTRDSILKALSLFGFVNIVIGFEQLDHINGPAFALCASK